jgi:tRNA-modifying protein YgfZ
MIELTSRRLGVDASVASDYEAFHDGAALVDLSNRGRMRFHGAGARDALNGLLTCDVAPLTSGQGAYGVALTNKGKIIADVAVFAMDESFLVEVPAGVWVAWKDLVAKFVNPRVSRRTDETDLTAEVGLFGPRSASIAAALVGGEAQELDALPIYGHRTFALDRVTVNVARIPDFGVDGFRLLTVRDGFERLRDAALSQGARMAGDPAIEAVRVEAGRPVWGVDMDDSTLPQEANLEPLGAISYTKGCYTGQEVVARLHFRGHVNKRLVGLRVDGSAVPAAGTPVIGAEAKEVGHVRSAVALAMIRREVNPGDPVTIAIDGIESRATVSALPFNG